MTLIDAYYTLVWLSGVAVVVPDSIPARCTAR